MQWLGDNGLPRPGGCLALVVVGVVGITLMPVI